MKRFDYDKKKNQELQLYEKSPDGKYILHHSPLFRPESILFSYIFPRKQMAEVIRRRNRGKKVDRLLIAPCGTGDDFEHLAGLAHQIYGIDLSSIAIKQCPAGMQAKVGDILETGYPDGTFDVVTSPLFFHHFLRLGFEPFLKEFYRILKDGGNLIILEPCIWYPLNIITRPLKIIFGNPFAEVKDEGPFNPGLMLKALQKGGFVNIEMQAASFAHCVFPVPFAKAVNRLTESLLNARVVKYLAWMVVYGAEK